VNGRRSYDPRAKTLPGVAEVRKPLLKLVVSNPPKED
jgi:hypothetical protein